MAKLILIALTFTALLAIASAYKTTTFVTTVDDTQSQQSCSREIQGQRFNQCQRYLQQSIQGGQQHGQQQQQQGLRSCCNELQNVDEMCQCEAVKQVFRDVQSQQQQQQQQGREQGTFGSQQIQRLKQQAQNLPNQCNLQTRQCQVGNIFITTTTILSDEESFRRPQQCQHVQQQSFNQCQRYVQQQIKGSPRLLMSINRQGSQQPQELEQCCRELNNVEEDCQCEAMQEVYWQAKMQQQQQQSSRRGGSQQQTEELKQVVQRLRNECNLEIEQCRIPSGMF